MQQEGTWSRDKQVGSRRWKRAVRAMRVVIGRDRTQRTALGVKFSPFQPVLHGARKSLLFKSD